MKKKDYIIIVFILLAGLGLFFGLKTYLDKNYEKKEDNSSEVDNQNNEVNNSSNVVTYSDFNLPKSISKEEFFKTDNLVNNEYLKMIDECKKDFLASNYTGLSEEKIKYCYSVSEEGGMNYHSFVLTTDNELYYFFTKTPHVFNNVNEYIRLNIPNKVERLYLSYSALNEGNEYYILLDDGKIYGIIYDIENQKASLGETIEHYDFNKYSISNTYATNDYNEVLGINLYNELYGVKNKINDKILVKYIFLSAENSNSYYADIIVIDTERNIYIFDKDYNLKKYSDLKVKNVVYKKADYKSGIYNNSAKIIFEDDTNAEFSIVSQITNNVKVGLVN